MRTDAWLRRARCAALLPGLLLSFFFVCCTSCVLFVCAVRLRLWLAALCPHCDRSPTRRPTAPCTAHARLSPGTGSPMRPPPRSRRPLVPVRRSLMRGASSGSRVACSCCGVCVWSLRGRGGARWFRRAVLCDCPLSPARVPSAGAQHTRCKPAHGGSEVDGRSEGGREGRDSRPKGDGPRRDNSDANGTVMCDAQHTQQTNTQTSTTTANRETWTTHSSSGGGHTGCEGAGRAASSIRVLDHSAIKTCRIWLWDIRGTGTCDGRG